MVELDQTPQYRLSRECALRGADFLDEHYPNWLSLIDVSVLDLSSGCNCVLGQLAAEYAPKAQDIWRFVAMETVIWPNVRKPVIFAKKTRLGFEFGYRQGDVSTDYESLTLAWTHVIYERRLAQSIV